MLLQWLCDICVCHLHSTDMQEMQLCCNKEWGWSIQKKKKKKKKKELKRSRMLSEVIPCRLHDVTFPFSLLVDENRNKTCGKIVKESVGKRQC